MEVQCNKIELKTFLQQEAGAFENNIGKEPQKPRLKLKNMYIIHLLIPFALPAIQCKC